MNCHGYEIKQYLESCPIFMEKYTIIIFFIKQSLDDNDIQNILKNIIMTKYDVVIMNDLDTHTKLKYKNIKKIVNSDTKIIKVGFFNTDAFIPYNYYFYFLGENNLRNVPTTILIHDYETFF